MAAAKKFINNSEDCVAEFADGLVASNPAMYARLSGHEGVLLGRHAVPPRAGGLVAIVSGGGAGHEPAHAGYVGRGMLSAAVSGGVFASPSVASILACVRAVTGEAGTLLVVKNYVRSPSCCRSCRSCRVATPAARR